MSQPYILFQTVFNTPTQKCYMSLISRCVSFLALYVFEIGMHLVVSDILVLRSSLSAFYNRQWYIESRLVS